LSESKSAIDQVPAEKPVLKHHLFSLRVKFIAVFTLLMLLVMGVVTILILYQVRQTLVEQIINRAEAQASSLATTSVDETLNELTPKSATTTGSVVAEDHIRVPLMQFVKDAMKEGSSSAVRDIPTGLSPWEEQILQTSNVAYGMIQKYLWPDEGQANGDMEYVKILDKNGNLMADNSIQDVIQNPVYKNPEGTKPLTDEAVLTQSYSSGGRTFYDIAAPIVNTAEGHNDKIGEVHIGMNQNTINRVVRYVAVSIVLTTVVFVLLGIIIVMIFVTIMIIPIKLLVMGVHAISLGNFDQVIKIHRGDELGDLTDAFNEMAKSLREKEVIKGAFSKYVTKSVVDRILQHQDGLKLGGEKKEVTVFFSDIRGFTPMSEVLSAEEVVHLLNEYFTAMTTIIFKYEGTLDKFMGDAIMAVYGAPIDMTDHAERAVLAAIEMSEKMKELQAKWKLEGKREVNIGIGINTGEVVVGNIGSNERMEYTAIGDNVNLTQRLESVAEKGQILISAATYERVKHKVNATVLDPIKVKGKVEKVLAYSVTGLKG
jgi:class 3 adenylate cyclase